MDPLVFLIPAPFAGGGSPSLVCSFPPRFQSQAGELGAVTAPRAAVCSVKGR